MRILLVEPFYGGSHKVWADNVQEIFGDIVDIITLPDRFWKWRMEGGAWELARQYKNQSISYDVIVVSDLINLSLFLSLADIDRKQTRVLFYMHENQLSYPWSKTDKDVGLDRDRHYGFINIMNTIVADQVFFNSRFHREDFGNAIEPFLSVFPDSKIEFTKTDLDKKSDVLPIPLHLKKMIGQPKIQKANQVVLWNHRWEYDKNPDLFFNTLFQLKEEGLDFKLNVIGQKYKRYPEIFDVAAKELSEEILHFGYVKSNDDYLDILAESTVLPVSSNHDFFGISVIEAMAAGCVPLFPRRLVYPDHLDVEKYSDLFYDTEREFKTKLSLILSGNHSDVSVAREMLKYDIDTLKPVYFEKILAR